MKNKENNSQTLKWVYRRIKRYIPLTAAVSVISALSALSFVALALITKRVLDVATNETPGSLLKNGILLFAVIAFQILLSAAQSLLNAYSNGKQTIAFRNHLFGVLCRKKYSDISAYHSGDILNRFTSDIDTVVTSSVNIIPNVISMATKIIAGIGTMLVLNPYIAGAVLFCGVTVPAIGRAINKKYKYMHKECQKTEGKTRAFMQECFENIVVIKTFISEVPFINKLDSYMDKNFRLKIKRTSISPGLKPLKTDIKTALREKPKRAYAASWLNYACSSCRTPQYIKTPLRDMPDWKNFCFPANWQINRKRSL